MLGINTLLSQGFRLCKLILLKKHYSRFSMENGLYQEYDNTSHQRKLFSLTWKKQSSSRLYQVMCSRASNERNQPAVLELLFFFSPSPPLHQSESSYLGCPSSFDVAAISKGLLSFWADRRSTPLIPIYGGWMEKTEDSTAYGSNRSASPLLWSLSSHFFIGEVKREKEDNETRKVRC